MGKGRITTSVFTGHKEQIKLTELIFLINMCSLNFFFLTYIYTKV